MTQLIAALDTEESLRHVVALSQAGVKFFKLNAVALMSPSLRENLYLINMVGAGLFMDLKLYDTRDTVYNIASRAFALGARFLTVHATPSMLEAAMRAKEGSDYAKVLAVGMLTDGSGSASKSVDVYQADGLICSVNRAATWPKAARRGLIVVCPGIRLKSDIPWLTDNHTNPATPAEAKDAGADYTVVGRPIYAAPHPNVAARAIMDELR